MIRYILCSLFFSLSLCNRILIPMDLAQTDHLKAETQPTPSPQRRGWENRGQWQADREAAAHVQRSALSILSRATWSSLADLPSLFPQRSRMSRRQQRQQSHAPIAGFHAVSVAPRLDTIFPAGLPRYLSQVASPPKTFEGMCRTLLQWTQCSDTSKGPPSWYRDTLPLSCVDSSTSLIRWW